MVVINRNKERSYTGDYKVVGKRAEKVVFDFISRLSSIVSIEDVREDKAMQDREIDFIGTLKNGKKIALEVKSDKYLGKSGNILFELLRINHTVENLDFSVKCGWSVRSRATHFFIYAPNINSIYLIKADDLRTAFQKYTQEKRGQSKIIFVETDRIKSTINMLIPESYVKKNIYKLG